MVRWCWVTVNAGRPTNVDNSRARAYSAYSADRGLFGHCLSLSSVNFLLSPSLWETARCRLKYCLKGPLTPQQPTSQNCEICRAQYLYDV